MERAGREKIPGGFLRSRKRGAWRGARQFLSPVRWLMDGVVLSCVPRRASSPVDLTAGCAPSSERHFSPTGTHSRGASKRGHGPPAPRYSVLDLGPECARERHGPLFPLPLFPGAMTSCVMTDPCPCTMRRAHPFSADPGPLQVPKMTRSSRAYFDILQCRS